jgi:hypothetical protein
MTRANDAPQEPQADHHCKRQSDDRVRRKERALLPEDERDECRNGKSTGQEPVEEPDRKIPDHN